MKIFNQKNKGVTLIEMLLVLVAISILVFAGLSTTGEKIQAERIDRTGLQMQQILNAGMSYYITHGSWPAALADLQPTYLPADISSPWNAPYIVGATSDQLFTVSLTLPTMANQDAIGALIAGKLPIASFAAGTITARVNIPGQDLNDSTSMNFVGLYHHGGCIPVPQCPVDPSGNRLTPEVIVTPVSVSGVNDASNSQNVYPISSFTAYATGPDTNPSRCAPGVQVACNPNKPSPSGMYWRACLQVITERGEVAATNPSYWGQYVTLGAFTRCSVTGGGSVVSEPTGSAGTVFSN